MAILPCPLSGLGQVAFSVHPNLTPKRLCMNALNNLKLRTKLLTGFFLVALITLVVGAFGTIRLQQMAEADTLLYQRVTLPMGEISDIAVSFQRVRINLRDVVESKDEKEIAAARETIKVLSARISEKLTSFEKTILSEEGRKLFAELTSARKDYVAVLNKVLELDAAGRDAEAKELVRGEGKQAALRYQATIEKLVESKDLQGKITNTHNAETAASSTLLMYILMGVSFCVSIGLGLLITSNVSGQLGEDPGYLGEVASEIAGGNLNVSFRPQKKQGGVYHVMQGMVQTMKAKIREAEQKSVEAAEQARLAGIATDEANQAKAKAERAKAEGMIEAATQLEKVVEVISSASEELSAQVEQSSRGTEMQSQRVAETATAMEEMNATVLEVAKSASQGADSSADARAKALEGAKIVAQVVAGIGSVQAVSFTMKEDMGELGKQAEGIGAIMNVISDIADQTNLLALNAAIEAARAGDAGRGFAVVADEVRKLAEKTMTATKEVGEAIGGIQQGTRKNLENVERAVHSIEQATGLANQSGEALQMIVHLVEVSTDQVRSIAAASEQQSAASEEINRSIEEINRISSETASAMNQSAQAVGDLANQAGNLRQLIEKMKAGA
jgi:methyl-accepting chemotaxis protein